MNLVDIPTVYGCGKIIGPWNWKCRTRLTWLIMRLYLWIYLYWNLCFYFTLAWKKEEIAGTCSIVGRAVKPQVIYLNYCTQDTEEFIMCFFRLSVPKVLLGVRCKFYHIGMRFVFNFASRLNASDGSHL